MTISPTPIAGVYQVKLNRMADDRGYFIRLFCQDELLQQLGDRKILQSNYSFTKHQGTIRGMHFQYPPFAETKLVQCMQGVVLDVVVDLRAKSPSYLKHVQIELVPGENMVLIPEGCAHGFQTLQDNCAMLYFHTAFYNKSAESGVRFDDPILRIDWPMPATNISPRDASFQLIDDNFAGIDTQHK